MTDRDLLEAVANAVEIDLSGATWSGTFVFDAPRTPNWNPLTNDGDAFRIAVKLKFDILPGETSVLVFVSRNHPQRFQAEEEFGGDPAAATRRAIVRTAAAMGKFTKPQRTHE